MSFQYEQEWQLTKKNVLERSQFMFNNSLMSDVQFICGDAKRTFYAHKYVLATTSPVLFAMFYGDISTTQTEICLSDTDDETFEEFLRFVYTDNCQLTQKNAMKMLYLAKKYMLPLLKEKCVDELKKIIKAENVVRILEESLLFEEKDLAEKCWEVVELETRNVITSKDFQEISQATLINLLKRKSLNISEVMLFQVVVQWTVSKCSEECLEASGKNKRLVAGNALQEISFLTMTEKEFAQYVPLSGLLTDREIIPIYAKFNGLDKPALKWKLPNRKQKLGKQIRLARCSPMEVHPPGSLSSYSGEPDCLRFTVDKQVYIHGVRLFGDANGSEYYVDFEINGLKTSSTYASCTNKVGIYGFDVILRSPVLVKKNETVTMSATIKGPISCYMTNVQNTSVTLKGVTLTFSSFSRPTNGTDVTWGQFYEIILSI